jgi:N-acetylglucosamine-6-phosphate deacetylase
MALIQNGIVLLPDGTLKKLNIHLKDGTIKALGENLMQEGEEVIDANGCMVVPGFVDIHIHGAGGADFSDGNKNAIDTIATYLLKQGVTAFLGTTMSLEETSLSDVMEAAASLIGKTRDNKAVLWGVHMEGPFIAISKKGGQNGEFIVNPDIEMFHRLYEKSKKGIKLIDIAPELEGSMDFIEQAKSLCRISLAHTEADYDIAKQALQKGASHITHLYNAMAPINHRKPGLIIAAVEDAEYIEIICDGNHIHPAVIRFTFRLFGRERVCIISDSMRACGLEDGEYELGGQVVYVKGDRAMLSDGTLAGSTTSTAEGVRRAVRFGVPIEDALLAATLNPAKAVGLDHIIGSFKPGTRADIILLDQQLNVKSVYLEGRQQQLS